MTFAARPWDCVVTLAGADVSSSTIGTVNVKIPRNANRTAAFTYVPPAGSIDPNDWAGKAVTIDIEDSATTVYRVFTGVVDTPVFDVASRTVRMNCTQNRNGLLAVYDAAGLATLITGSRWSEHIFDPDSDIPRIAADRLRTIDKALDFDGSNAPVLTSLAAGSADITLAADEVRDESVSVSLASREDLVNQIDVKYKYRFTRLRHREHVYDWDYPGNTAQMATYVADPTTLAYKDQILEAAAATGLVLRNNWTLEPLGASGWYGGVSFVIAESERQKYALKADFTLMQRFTQSVTEFYTVTVKGTQSVTQFGSVYRSAAYGLTAEYNSDDWDDLDSYQPPTGTLSPNGDYITDKTTGVDSGDRTESDAALECAMAIARCDILAAHRKNQVDFTTLDVRPEILIQHTLQLNSTPVTCKGVIDSIEHVLHIGDDPSVENYTRVSLALSRVENAAPTENAIAAPTPPDTSDAGPAPTAIVLGNHFGNHAASPAYDETWDGLIGNYKFHDAIQTMEIYPEAFVIDVPEVDDADRNDREAAAASTHEIVIPNDQLVLN